MAKRTANAFLFHLLGTIFVGLATFSSLTFANVNGTEITCPLPPGVEAPEEVLIGGMIINPPESSFLASILRIAVELINLDGCLLPGFYFPFFTPSFLLLHPTSLSFRNPIEAGPR